MDLELGARDAEGWSLVVGKEFALQPRIPGFLGWIRSNERTPPDGGTGGGRFRRPRRQEQCPFEQGHGAY